QALADILSRPTSEINPRDVMKTLADRDDLYENLSKEMVVTHAPAFMSEVVQNFDNYNQQDKDAIDGAIENRIRSEVEQKTGVRLTGDQIAGALNLYTGLVKYAERIGFNGDPLQFVDTAIAQANGIRYGMPVASTAMPGYVPQSPPYDLAERYAAELG